MSSPKSTRYQAYTSIDELPEDYKNLVAACTISLERAACMGELYVMAVAVQRLHKQAETIYALRQRCRALGSLLQVESRKLLDEANGTAMPLPDLE